MKLTNVFNGDNVKFALGAVIGGAFATAALGVPLAVVLPLGLGLVMGGAAMRRPSADQQHNHLS